MKRLLLPLTLLALALLATIFFPCPSFAQNMLELRTQLTDTMSDATRCEAIALRQEHKYPLSIRYAAAALDSARRFSFTGVIRECYSVLCADYRGLRDFASALFFSIWALFLFRSNNQKEKLKRQL